MMWLALGLITWVVCGILTYGLTFAYFQGEWLDSDAAADRAIAWNMAIGGPIGLMVALVCGGVKYGIKFRG